MASMTLPSASNLHDDPAGRQGTKMKHKSRVVALALHVALFAGSLSDTSHAQEWPAKVTRIMVGTAAGGTADTLARLVADRFTETFKQSFVVENRTGAGGVIAMEFVRKSAPDGSTLLVTGGSQHTILPSMIKNFPYDPVRDITALAYLGGPPTVLVVHPGVLARDLKEFIALAKAQPGTLTFGSPGNGTHGHLTAEHFKQLTGIQMTHVPYRGSNPALADVVAGHVQAASMTLPGAGPQILAGKAAGARRDRRDARARLSGASDVCRAWLSGADWARVVFTLGATRPAAGDDATPERGSVPNPATAGRARAAAA
jgi:tripartite-type tricarboxylate transporter receptor subunit TctC